MLKAYNVLFILFGLQNHAMLMHDIIHDIKNVTLIMAPFSLAVTLQGHPAGH